MKLNQLTLRKTLDGLKNKQFSRTELVNDLTSAVQAHNKQLNVFLTDNPVQLQQSEQRASLPLAGVPIAVKDNFCTKGIRTTASSTVLDSFVSPYESTVTQKLQTAGAVIQGKTNLDAWAHGSSTETSQYGRSLNPRNPKYLPGGSSGGSAAAVAGDLSIVAIGSETAGSIRQPAAWCGCVGLKPSYGRCSRFGVVAMASSTDSPGPIGKTVEDTAILFNHMAGHDNRDSTSSTHAVPDLTQSLDTPIKGLKIGLLYQDIQELRQVNSQVQQAANVLTELGAHVEPTQALDPHHAIGVYTVVQRSEVSSNLGRYDGVRYGADRSTFGDEARRRIMLGTFSLSRGYADKYYVLAQKVRTLFQQDFARLFNTYDVLISATSPGFAKKVGATDGAAMFGELEDMLLEPTSITGLPGINVPCYHDPATNLFLGLNIMAPMWREDLVVQVADAYEKHTDWNTWRRA